MGHQRGLLDRQLVHQCFRVQPNKGDEPPSVIQMAVREHHEVRIQKIDMESPGVGNEGI